MWFSTQQRCGEFKMGESNSMLTVVSCYYFRAQHHMRPTITCPRDVTSSQHSEHSVLLVQIIQEYL